MTAIISKFIYNYIAQKMTSYSEFENLLKEAENGNIYSVLAAVDCDKTLINRQGEQAKFLLYNACISGNKNFVHQLIQRGANVNQNEGAGWTALYAACCFNEGRQDIATLLLQYGANPNTTTVDGFTPIKSAFLYGYITLGIFLFSRGAILSAEPYSRKFRNMGTN